MRLWKSCLVVATLVGAAIALSGCGQVDETILSGNADFSVDINIPYTTTTPLPDYLNVPEQVVIDQNGGVTVNDSSLLTGGMSQSQYDESGYSSLSLGDSNPAVSALQERLSDLGYYTGEISGVFDNATESAVKRFEQTYGVMQTGIATPSFQARLFADDAPEYGSDAYDSAVVAQYTTLQRGAVGSQVYALQHRLKELGYPIRELTGVYDEETEQAVALFSEAYGLRAQTVAYIALQKELYADTAIAYTPGATTEAGALTVSYATLSLGNVGTQVMRIQNRLIDLGYLAGPATGVFDAETQAAVMAFEETCGRAATGVLDASLQNLIMSDSAPAAGETLAEVQILYADLSLGSEGDQVSSLQNRLIQLGYASGEATGSYGEETANALSIFQRMNGLQETGVATGEVQTYLYSPAALSYAAAAAGVTPNAQPTDTPAPTNTPTPVDASGTPQPAQEAAALRSGDEGDAVTALQERLNALGYACTVNGVYDDETRQAVAAFQSAVGVPQTGEATDSMIKYLMTRAAPASKYRMFNATQDFTLLQEGDTGEAVASLQWQLWTLGYMTTEAVEATVGAFDATTKNAVISVQYAMGYEQPDGVAGPELQCFIFSDYNKFIKK